MTNIYLTSVNEWISKAQKIGYQSDQILKTLHEVYESQTLHERINALYQLKKTCELKSRALSHADLRYQLIDNLHNQVTTLLKALLDVKTDAALQVAIKPYKTNPLNAFSSVPKLIPNQNFSKNKIKKNNDPTAYAYINNKFEEKDRNYHVNYLGETQREKFRVIISNGLLHKLDCSGQDDKQKLVLKPFNTLFINNINSDENGQAVFVVDKRGNMFAGSDIENLHHSSFVSGKEVFFAGLIKTNSKGVIQEVGNQSGHYKPNKDNLVNFLKYLNKRGALTHKLDISLVQKTRDKGTTYAKHDLKPAQMMAATSTWHKKETSPWFTNTLQTWYSESRSNVPFFAHRYQELKKIDRLLKDYFEKRHTNKFSPDENLHVLTEINHLIQKQRKERPNSKRQEAINRLHDFIQKESKHWIEKKSKLSKKI